ncbi:hypothetical protein [Polymorphospora sp. NPDC050346]|uniref:hypothetical protein n=1 Tax=Polymorphospora sp. NPDC050346 TaxID=3155780 RepID=UPI003400E081
MTSLMIPPSGGSEPTGNELVRVDVTMLRAAYQRPPDVRRDLGAWSCPLDDTMLRSSAALGGWMCDTCLAGWNGQGQQGRWLAWRPMVELRPGPDGTVRPPGPAGGWVVPGVGLVAALLTAGFGAYMQGADLAGVPVPADLVYGLAGLIVMAAVVWVIWAVIRRDR